MKKATDIFAHTNCISEEMLTKYVSCELSSEEKHNVEKHLVDCEMCSDAVEGLKIVGDEKKISQITSDLNRKIQTRINATQEKKEGKVIFLYQYRSQLAVAASVVVLLGLVWLFRSDMSMREMDSASSEKIFADKFEPYPAAEEENSAPVSESPELNKSAPEEAYKESERRDRNDPIHAEDKRAGGAGAVIENQLAEEVAKTEKEYYTAPAEQKQAVPPPPVASSSGGQSIERDEETSSGRSADKAPKQQAPAKPSMGATSASSPVTEKATRKENEGANLRESNKDDQQVESMALAKSQETKSRSKAKKPAEPQAIAEQELMMDASTNEEVVVPDTLGAAGSASGEQNMAMQKYEQKNYEGALEDFERTLAKEPNNYSALFYSSVSYLSTSQTDKAITNLNKVMEKKNGEYYDAAQWYLSLAYIKKDDTKNARKNLVELQNNSNSKYQKQADETLREMKK